MLQIKASKTYVPRQPHLMSRAKIVGGHCPNKIIVAPAEPLFAVRLLLLLFLLPLPKCKTPACAHATSDEDRQIKHPDVVIRYLAAAAPVPMPKACSNREGLLAIAVLLGEMGDGDTPVNSCTLLQAKAETLRWNHEPVPVWLMVK